MNCNSNTIYIYFRCLLWIMKVSILTYLILFGILPIIFHYSYAVQKKILFLNFGKYSSVYIYSNI